jgi:hypothetical protein
MSAGCALTEPTDTGTRNSDAASRAADLSVRMLSRPNEYSNKMQI